MVGYVLALFVDQLTGAGLVDQQSSFLGKIALTLTVLAVLAIRSQSDLEKYRNLVDEATFYNRQVGAKQRGTGIGRVRARVAAAAARAAARAASSAAESPELHTHGCPCCRLQWNASWEGQTRPSETEE